MAKGRSQYVGSWGIGWFGVAAVAGLAVAVGMPDRKHVVSSELESVGANSGAGIGYNAAAGGLTQGLISHVIASPGQATSLVVVDPQKQAVAVYQIHRDSGSIELKSTRTIRWDLELSEYNSSSPLPEEIRKGLARQR